MPEQVNKYIIQVIYDWRRKGKSYREIAIEFGKSTQWVAYVVKRYLPDGSPKIKTIPAPRKRKTTLAQDRKIISLIRTNGALTYEDIQYELRKDSGIEISKTTIAKRLHQAGFRRILPEQDEGSLTSGEARVDWVYRRPDSPPPEMLTQWLNEAGLDLFGSTQIRNESTDSSAVLCYQVEQSNLSIWLIDAKHISHIRFTEQNLKEKCRSLKVTPVELLKALREGFVTKSATFTSSPSSTDVTFSSTQSGKIRIELCPEEPEGDLVRSLLLAFGRAHSDMKQELDSTKSKMEESATRVFTQSAMLDTDHRPAKKKPRAEPGMSVVNPRSRIVKPPRGVVYSDEEEE